MIKNIIFDLGNVLVNVEYERFRNRIYSSGISEEAYDNFFMGGNYRLLGYESGDISTEDFIARCINGLKLNMTRSQFADAFNDMFSEIEGMSRIVREFSAGNKYRLFLLSNTSPLHFEYIKKNFEYVNLLHRFGLSYELKSLKPEEEIYSKAVKYLEIEPAETLFVDDLEENCRGAEKYGISAICYDKNRHSDFVKEFNHRLNGLR